MRSSTDDLAIWFGDSNYSRKAEEFESNKSEKGISFLFKDINPEKERYKFVRIYVFSLIKFLQI